jgi:nitrogenase subunit NifH
MASSKKPPHKTVKLKSLKRKSMSVQVTARVKGGVREGLSSAEAGGSEGSLKCAWHGLDAVVKRLEALRQYQMKSPHRWTTDRG